MAVEQAHQRLGDHRRCHSRVAAKALDPSIHLGDTQEWLNVRSREEDVMMKMDMRSQGG